MTKTKNYEEIKNNSYNSGKYRREENIRIYLQYKTSSLERKELYNDINYHITRVALFEFLE